MVWLFAEHTPFRAWGFSTHPLLLGFGFPHPYSFQGCECRTHACGFDQEFRAQGASELEVLQSSSKPHTWVARVQCRSDVTNTSCLPGIAHDHADNHDEIDKKCKDLAGRIPQKVVNFRGELPARQTEVATESALPQTRAGTPCMLKSQFSYYWQIPNMTLNTAGYYIQVFVS